MMSEITGDNNARKPDEKNGQSNLTRGSSMWCYCGLLSGSLLMAGGIAGSRLFRLSHSFGWSLLRFSASVTGMYLTLSSFQKLYNRSRESISEEVENSDIILKHSQVHENRDKIIKKIHLHLIECTESTTAEDNIVENAIDNTADEKVEVLINAVTDINVNPEENITVEDSAEQHSSNESIALKCEGTKIILLKEVKEDCAITQDLVEGDTKDAEVVKNEAIVNVNSKDDKTVFVQAKDIAFKTTGFDENTSVEIKNAVANVFCEDVEIRGNEDNSSKDSNVNFPVAVDCLNESIYNEAVACLKEYNIKETSIETNIATDTDISDLLASDDLTGKLDEDITTNEILEDVPEIFLEKIEETAKHIFETSVASVDVDNRNIIKKGDENESCEMVYKEVKSEAVALMFLSIRNTIPEKNENLGKFGLENSKNDLEECKSKESEIDIVSKGIGIENKAYDNVVIEDKLNKDNLEVNILQDEFIMKVKTKEVVAKNTAISKTLVKHEVSERDLTDNIVSNASKENRINRESSVEDVMTKCSSIEDDVVKVEETFYNSLLEEQLKNIFQNNVTVDDIRNNIVDNEISTSSSDSPCIVVDQATLFNETEIQNEYEVKAKTEEQNENEALRTKFNPDVSLTKQYPKLEERPTAQHINQFLSDSTDELRFISPNSASGIGVFFSKSNKTRLAAQFQNSTTESLKPSSNTIYASTKKNPNLSDSRPISPISESLNFSERNVGSASNKYSIGLSPDINIVLDTNNRQSTGTSSSSVVFHKDQTCDANLPTGQTSSDSESVVVAISQLLDVADNYSTDRHLRLPDTTTTSIKDSSPVISDKAVSIPIQSEKPSENIYDLPVDHLLEPIGSPSNKPRKLSPKTPETKCSSFSGHSLRSPTFDRHSPSSPDPDNSYRRTKRSSVGGSGYSQRASRNSAVSQSRRSFGSEISPLSEPRAGELEDDVFSQAADSPWTSCDDISQAGHPPESFGKDVFASARISNWYSCGDVSSQARHSNRTTDGDVFSNARNSPWASGSGTIFPARRSRKTRPSSHSRYSRIASGSSGVPRVRHSPSPTVCVDLPTEKSPTRDLRSPSRRPASAGTSPSEQSIDYETAASLAVQSTEASVVFVSTDRQSPNTLANTSHPITEQPLRLLVSPSSDSPPKFYSSSYDNEQV